MDKNEEKKRLILQDVLEEHFREHYKKKNKER
jgi:hypothetical protein